MRALPVELTQAEIDACAELRVANRVVLARREAVSKLEQELAEAHHELDLARDLRARAIDTLEHAQLAIVPVESDA